MSTKMNIEGHKKADSQKGHSRQKDISKTQRAKRQRPSVPPSGSKIASHKENQPKKLKKLKQKKLLNKVFSCMVGDEIYSAIEEEYFGKRQG